MLRVRWSTLATVGSAVAAIAAVAFVVWRNEPSGWLNFLLDEDTNPFLFVGLMTMLPVLGFPISIFLILAGTKFGVAGGMTVAAVTVGLHLGLSLLLARSLLRPFLSKILRRFDAGRFDFGGARVGLYSFVFMAIPGLPYAVKNYTLALYGVPLRYYFGFGWSVNLVLGLPLVGLGAGAARLDPKLVALFVALLLIGYLAIRWLRGRLAEGSEEEG